MGFQRRRERSQIEGSENRIGEIFGESRGRWRWREQWNWESLVGSEIFRQKLRDYFWFAYTAVVATTCLGVSDLLNAKLRVWPWLSHEAVVVTTCQHIEIIYSPNLVYYVSLKKHSRSSVILNPYEYEWFIAGGQFVYFNIVYCITNDSWNEFSNSFIEFRRNRNLSKPWGCNNVTYSGGVQGKACSLVEITSKYTMFFIFGAQFHQVKQCLTDALLSKTAHTGCHDWSSSHEGQFRHFLQKISYCCLSA